MDHMQVVGLLVGNPGLDINRTDKVRAKKKKETDFFLKRGSGKQSECVRMYAIRTVALML
jgi:hypothetical protein